MPVLLLSQLYYLFYGQLIAVHNKGEKLEMKKLNKLVLSILTLVAITPLCGFSFHHFHHASHYLYHTERVAKAYTSHYYHKYRNSSTSSLKAPSKVLADSAYKPVANQLPSAIFNGHGAYILNDNKPTIKVTTKVPYAVNTVDSLNRPVVGNALLNKTTRQYANRTTTNNGASDWVPQGYHQSFLSSGSYTHVYDRGHLLGYALVGGIKGFDASEHNAKNIAAQTMWANEAVSSTSTGQNYYEGIVRKALDNGKTVRYQVTDIYNGNSLVPSGAHIQAQSSDKSVSFNVFVPNVQTGITINYLTGYVTK